MAFYLYILFVTFFTPYLNEHGLKEERENEFKYYCKICDLGTFSKDIYNNHINSEKHKKHEKRLKL